MINDSPDELNSYEAPLYSLSGSDLDLESPEKVLSELETYLEWLRKKTESDHLTVRDIEVSLLEDAEYVQQEFQRRLDELSEQDVLFAGAVQDWVIAESRKREAARGQAYDLSSVDNYRETIAILDMLIAELQQDEEDTALIEIAKVWRQETHAELDLARLKHYYSLVA